MKKIVLSFLIFLWVGFIFYNSLMPASLSSTQSMGVVRWIHELITKIGMTLPIHVLSTVVRKLAHVFEYFVLCILMLTLLIEFNLNTKRVLVYGLLGTLLVASVDETIQLFVIGRYGSVIDVGIDMIGAILGTLLVWAIQWLLYRKKEKKKA